MGGLSKFNQTWLKDFQWLKPCKGDIYSAFCTYCNSTILIKHAGKSALTAHAGTGSHGLEEKRMRESRTIVSDVSSDTADKVMKVSAEPATRNFEESVLNAEVLQAFNVVDKNQSFQSADGDNERFARQFPDSKIAQSYQLGQTKLKYLVQFGIAPHIKELLLEDMKEEQYCFHFDETTTEQVKKQYDAYITYFSKTSKQVVCEYAGSLFVGRCPAEALLEHFFHFIQELKLDLDNLLNLGMDGPNVNKKFEHDLKEELEKNNDNSFISCGSCPLHTVHNAFGKGMESLKERINLDQFVIDLHFFFERSAGRREDFKKMELITDITVHYLLRHCESRWLSIEKILVRIMEQFANIKTYFLTELPKTQAFKGKKGVGNTKRYQRIAECLKDPSLMCFMGFVVFISQDFKKFLVPLQTSAPMIHVLHAMQVKLVHSLMSKFIDSQFITDAASKKTLGASKLIEVDVSDKRKHLAKVQVGAKATSEMKSLDELEKKKAIASMITFLEECTQYLLTNLPFADKVIKNAKCLHPENRHSKSSLNSISYLAQVVVKALGDDAMRKAFDLPEGQTKYDLIDKIRAQYQEYQTENISESLYKHIETEKKSDKPTFKQRTSYWKEAYEIAGILDLETENKDVGLKRLDDYWVAISELCDVNGKKRYNDLWVLVKCVMLISHGNADPERGFSINKHMLKIHGFSLGEDTIVALRLVKSYVIKCGGSEKVPVTNSLLKSCKLARTRYHVDLEEKRQAAIKEEAAKKAAAEALAANSAAQETKKKEDERKEKIQKEIDILNSSMKVAEQSIREGNDELQKVLTESSKLSKEKLVEKMTLCRAKIDMGVKRQAELEKDVQAKKLKLDKI